MPLMNASPECPMSVELETLAAKSESPITGHDMLFPARK